MPIRPTPYEVASKLVSFYEQPFGGKPSGRFRVSPKNLRRLMQRRRITDDYLKMLAEEMFELGFVFYDMETFYVVTSARTFTNYRRLSDALAE